ncbi:MAG: RNA pyrophosphohydrolase [Gemmatimonadetes bacterium]|nr:RNA pyrophosphohydrolase [Gemmatimonadota bacterium]
MTQFFRAGAGGLIVDEAGLVFAFERSDARGNWQLAQGGLDPGEEPLEAAYREIKEETGIKRKHLELLDPEPELLAYELPEGRRRSKLGRGQAHYWFAFRFLGRDSHITLGDQKEFRAWKRTTIHELIQQTAEFRRPVYERLSVRFANLFPTI